MWSFSINKLEQHSNVLEFYNSCFNDMIIHNIKEDYVNFYVDGIDYKRNHLQHLNKNCISEKNYAQLVSSILNVKGVYNIEKQHKNVLKDTYNNNIKMFSSFVCSMDQNFEFSYNRDVSIFDYYYKKYDENYNNLIKYTI